MRGDFSRDEDTNFGLGFILDGKHAGFARFFDIVNGFLIDAVAHCVCGDEPHVLHNCVHLQMQNLLVFGLTKD